MANTTPTGSTPAGTGSTPTTPAPSPSDKNVSSVKDFQKNIAELDREKFNQAQAALASAQALLNKFADIAKDPRGAAIAAARATRAESPGWRASTTPCCRGRTRRRGRCADRRRRSRAIHR